MTALDIAIADIGYTEYPPNSNKTKYGAWYGTQDKWCMMFVQYCFAMSCQPLPYKTASCSGLLNWYKKNAAWCVLKKPVKGAIAIFSFGHTGIVESYTAITVTCIEGNTSSTDKGSQDNGGGVYRRERKQSLVTAYIDPFAANDTPEGEIKAMKTVKGATTNEKNMIKAIQGAIGAVVDGEIGCQTMSDIACRLNAIKSPVTLSIYSTPCIIAKDIKPIAEPKKGLTSFSNSINGGFYASGKPCSICISGGVIKQSVSCHYWDGNGYPETVIYRDEKGDIGIKRVKSTNELPKCKWAVGGMGLLDFYNPAAEGFCKVGTKDFTDVLRKTNHSMLGIKNGYCYLVYAKNKTAVEVNALAKKLGFEKAVMLDGGHICGMNGGEAFARINTQTIQYYVIQGV